MPASAITLWFCNYIYSNIFLLICNLKSHINKQLDNEIIEAKLERPFCKSIRLYVDEPEKIYFNDVSHDLRLAMFHYGQLLDICNAMKFPSLFLCCT